MRNAIIAIFALVVLACAATEAEAQVATIYVNTGGASTNSGTTDTSSATATGTAGAWTTGTATVTLDTNTNLTGVAQNGSQSIYLNNATNTVTNIFWIASFSGCTGSGSCVVTLEPAGSTAPDNPALPTCSTCSGSSWAVGGQYVWPSGGTADVVEGSLRPGDTIQFDNTPATKSGQYFEGRNSGVYNAPITIQGKSGVVPTLEVTNGSTILFGNNQNFYVIKNLYLKVDVTTGGEAVSGFAGNLLLNSVKASGGQPTINLSNAAVFFNSEITGSGTDGIDQSSNGITLIGSYVHNNTRDGVRMTQNNACGTTVIRSLIVNNTGRGVYCSGSNVTTLSLDQFYESTIASNGNSGHECVSAACGVIAINNIFENNGTASGQYNLLWDAGSEDALGYVYHGYNVFYHSNCQGSNTGGPSCVSGITLNSTEQTADAVFANASGGNFAIGSSGSAASNGFPGTPMNSSSTGYLDIGAIQRQVTGGGGHIIGGWLMRDDLDRLPAHNQRDYPMFLRRVA